MYVMRSLKTSFRDIEDEATRSAGEAILYKCKTLTDAKKYIEYLRSN
jgi:hypothetical protein